MRRGLLLFAALAGAFLIAALAGRPPAAAPAASPPQRFSAERALADVRAIAEAPHPTGSPDAARVRDHLVRRLESLGLEVSLQTAPLSADARRRLRAWGATDAPQLVNVVGLLRGADAGEPAILLMAHYDSVAGSPGAADDGAGVAAILEVVRALRAGPPLRRDLVVAFTDAEELNLDGARAFFGSHPLGPRVGVVVNLEARGGAGRALMFETGRGDAGMMRLYAGAVSHPSAQSLAVLIYRLMPNSSDFTAADRRPGFNFAFMGGADQYHSPEATADRLSPASLQHIGGQALDLVRALTQSSALPHDGGDAVFSDLLGLTLVIHPPWVGWAPLAASAALLALAALRRGGAARLRVRDWAGGAAAAAAVLLHAVLALDLFNRLSGAGPGAAYYDRLAALPRLELQAAGAAVAALLAVLGLRDVPSRRLAAAPALVLGGLDMLLGAGPPITAAVAATAAGLAAAFAGPSRDQRDEWSGALILLLVAATAIQAVGPTAGPLFGWPLLAGCLSLAAAAIADPRLRSWLALTPAALLGAVAGAQTLMMAHLAFLGVGAELAPAMAVFVLPVAILLWPLAPRRIGRPLGLLLAVVVLVTSGLALSVRLDPPAASAPAWAR